MNEASAFPRGDFHRDMDDDEVRQLRIDLAAAFRLDASECIVFDNHRIVHGRSAYSATSGERYLRGCYADRGEMRSAYRALTTEGRFK